MGASGKYLVLLCLVLALCGCSYEEHLPTDVVLCNESNRTDSRRLLLTYVVEGRGSAHYPGITKWKREERDLLVVKSDANVVNDDHLSLFLYDARTPAEKISGRVSFVDGYVSIELRFLTHPAPGKNEWQKYPRNGKYALRPGECAGI